MKGIYLASSLLSSQITCSEGGQRPCHEGSHAAQVVKNWSILLIASTELRPLANNSVSEADPPVPSSFQITAVFTGIFPGTSWESLSHTN